MTATPPRDAGSADLLVVGGGPAGCAAGVMAASLGMRSVLIEADALCGKLQHIPAVDNVLGGFTDGPGLAAAIAGDIARTGRCRVLPGSRATEIRAYDDHVTVTLDSGGRLTAPHVVVSTGVGPLTAGDAPWLTVPDGRIPPSLWGATVDEGLVGSLLVLGADRPLGTFLRARPALDVTVLVACPPQDDYKTGELRGDPRVTLLPVSALTLRAQGGAWAARWADRNGESGEAGADAVFLNLGSAPAPPPGDLIRDALGYCAPGRQHPRILVAGDLRSARFQRIAAATGSGSEAALRAYYTDQGLPLV